MPLCLCNMSVYNLDFENLRLMREHRNLSTEAAAGDWGQTVRVSVTLEKREKATKSSP